MKTKWIEIFDTFGPVHCVRFLSGEVGLLDDQGTELLRLGKWQRLLFYRRGFLKAWHNGMEFYVDTKSGEIFSQMPEILQIGPFEIVEIAGFLYTRTRKIYEVKSSRMDVSMDRGGFCLYLPYRGRPEEETESRMLGKRRDYRMCLLNGDEEQVYWLIEKLPDGSLIVMSDEGRYYRAQKSGADNRAVISALGCVTDGETLLQMRAVVVEQRRKAAAGKNKSFHRSLTQEGLSQKLN